MVGADRRAPRPGSTRGSLEGASRGRPYGGCLDRSRSIPPGVVAAWRRPCCIPPGVLLWLVSVCIAVSCSEGWPGELSAVARRRHPSPRVWVRRAGVFTQAAKGAAGQCRLAPLSPACPKRGHGQRPCFDTWASEPRGRSQLREWAGSTGLAKCLAPAKRDRPLAYHEGVASPRPGGARWAGARLVADGV